MIGNWFPVKIAEIDVCCSSDDSEQKFSWHQLSKMILNQSKRHLKMHTALEIHDLFCYPGLLYSGYIYPE